MSEGKNSLPIKDVKRNSLPNKLWIGTSSKTNSARSLCQRVFEESLPVILWWRISKKTICSPQKKNSKCLTLCSRISLVAKKFGQSRDSSVGRGPDWRSEGPWLGPGSRQFSLPSTQQVTRSHGGAPSKSSRPSQATASRTLLVQDPQEAHHASPMYTWAPSCPEGERAVRPLPGTHSSRDGVAERSKAVVKAPFRKGVGSNPTAVISSCCVIFG